MEMFIVSMNQIYSRNFSKTHLIYLNMDKSKIGKPKIFKPKNFL